MLTNFPAAVVMIVFAGGPHTPERTALARELMAAYRPAAVYLTGVEYRGEYSNLVGQVAAEARKDQPGPPPVLTDTCSSTWESCRTLTRLLRSQNPPVTRVVVVTSNYHAQRARWLLAGLLSNRISIDLHTSPDIPWRDSFATPRNRTLVLGECLSWPYCFVLGLLCRPWLLAVAIILTLGGLALHRRSRGLQRNCNLGSGK